MKLLIEGVDESRQGPTPGKIKQSKMGPISADGQ